MKIYASVITYKPDLDLLKKSIACYLQHVDKVLIWSNDSETGWEDAFFKNEKLVFAGEDQNKGISYALNKIVSLCQQEQVDYLLTMDQDSLFPDFSSFKSTAFSLFDENSQIIAVGPEVNTKDKTAEKQECCPYLITSGSIVNIEKISKIGGYSEDFFVDGIDIELGYRAKKFGFLCYKLTDFNLVQNYGTTVQRAGFKSASYSPSRFYNIVRAYWVIIIKYFPKTLSLFGELLNKYYFRKPIAIILFQENKWAKLKAIFKGSIDGIKYIFK